MSFNSAQYWEKRYASGKNSGCGSYNHLAKFKADVLNNIITEYHISSMIDYGVGDGNQCSLIDTTNITYYGIDVSAAAINICKNKNLAHKQFMSVDEFVKLNLTCDLVISCDVIYHLIEDDVYNLYMKNLCSFSHKYIVIYAKNADVYHTQHVQFRKFSNYLDETPFKLIQTIPNPYPQNIIGRDNANTSPSDFYIFEK
jgi:hypothetical protein